MNFYDNYLDYKGVTALLEKSCQSGFPYRFITASQSSFADEACCLILASSQRKLREYNKFKKVGVTTKKNQNLKSFKIIGLYQFLPNQIRNGS